MVCTVQGAGDFVFIFLTCQVPAHGIYFAVWGAVSRVLARGLFAEAVAADGPMRSAIHGTVRFILACCAVIVPADDSFLHAILSTACPVLPGLAEPITANRPCTAVLRTYFCIFATLAETSYG